MGYGSKAVSYTHLDVYKRQEQKITFMDIELDSENQVVTKAGKEVELTPKEFELLEILMRNRNITLFRDCLLYTSGIDNTGCNQCVKRPSAVSGTPENRGTEVI